MPRGASLEWTTADEEDEEQPLLAEDYVWLMRNGLEGPPELIPDLARQRADPAARHRVLARRDPELKR